MKNNKKLSLFLGLILVGGTLLLLRLGSTYYKKAIKPIAIDRVEVINPFVNYYSEMQDKDPSTVIDGLVDNQYFIKVSPNHPSQLILYFSHPSNLTNIELFFPTKQPKNFTIEISNTNQTQWATFLKIYDNKLSSLNLTTQPPSIVNQASAIKLTLSESTSADGRIGIGEIRANFNKPLTLLDKITTRLFVVRREPISYIFYLTLIVLITLSIGFGFGNYQNKQITPLSLAIAWGKGIAIVSLMGLTKVVLFPETNFNYLFVILAIGCSIRAFQSQAKLPKTTTVIGLIVLVYIINSLPFFYFRDQYDINVTSVFDSIYDYSSFYPTPYGAYETDFMLPYGVTKIWNNTLNPNSPQVSRMMAGYQASDRTPLLSLYSIPFLNLFGDRFFIFEIVSIATIPLFLIGSWVLLEKIFGRKVAYLATILLAFNHWLFFAGNFAQVRLLVLFFISIFLYYSIKNKELQSRENSLHASFFASMAFLSHPFALVYIFPVAMYHLICYFRHPKKEKFINILRTYLIPLATFICWLIWAKTVPGNSLLVSTMTSGSWGNTFISMNSTSGLHIGNILDIIQAKIDNFIGIFIANPKASVVRTWGPLRTTFPLALGKTLLPFILLSLIFDRSKKNKCLLSFSSFVIFLTTFIFLSFYATLGLNWYHLGLIPLFIGVGTILIRKTPIWLQILVLISTLIEFYYVNWVYYPHEAGISFQRFLGMYPITYPVVIILLIIEVIFISFLIVKSMKD